MNGKKSSSWLKAVVVAASFLLSVPSWAEEGKKEYLSEKQLLAVLDCITRPGKIRLSKNYSGKGLHFRYSYGTDRRDSGPTMGLILYKRGGRQARYYMFYLDWSKDCPAIQLSNGADLYREKGKWESEIPFWFGGLGTMRAFAELPDEYAREKLHFVPARKIKRTCAKFDEGG